MSKPTTPVLDRRTVFAGAGAAGALAVAAVVLPGAPSAPSATVARAKPGRQDGAYQLTEHVKQYYDKARA